MPISHCWCQHEETTVNVDDMKWELLHVDVSEALYELDDIFLQIVNCSAVLRESDNIASDCNLDCTRSLFYSF